MIKTVVEAIDQIIATGRPHGSDANQNPCECDHCQNWDALNRLTQSSDWMTPTFEHAEKIVMDRVSQEFKNLKEHGCNTLMLYVGSAEIHWTAQVVGDYSIPYINAQTLAELISKIPPVKSPEEIKAEKIAKLKAELAELEGAK